MNRRFKTPMMQQYAKIKSQYKDCLLFFRLGDFYELFLEDAETGAKLLDITLTARHKGKDGKIPMCGVPYHALNSYLGKIIKAGYKAAICEQVSKPVKGKDVVEREVIRIITPGTVVDEKMLDEKTNNYLLTFVLDERSANFAYIDISTGALFVSQSTPTNNVSIYTAVADEIKKLNPSEIVLDNSHYSNYTLLKILRETGQSNIYHHQELKKNYKEKLVILKSFFKVKSLEIFDVNEQDTNLINAIHFLISYLQHTQKGSLLHIKRIINIQRFPYMKIDATTLKNLEIFQPSQIGNFITRSNSLFETIDRTLTSMGGRKLKKWITYPLTSKKEIESRQNATELLIKNTSLRGKINNHLKKILDIERLSSKLGTNTANARDLLALKDSLEHSLDVLSAWARLSSQTLTQKQTRNDMSKVIGVISKTIKEDPPVSIREGGIIKRGIDQELDDIKASISDSKKWIAELEGKERERTGISSLKIGFNSVFGYYIEISKANTKFAPDDYIRKQTLVNAERYITDELKYREEIVLNAEEKINELEYKIFQETVKKILNFVESIQQVAEIISKIDCLNSFAEVAIEKNYAKPKIFNATHFDTNLTEARHPVVESVLEAGEFTPNNTNLHKRGYIHLITGPNMSGKSTYIRQMALIQLLAQTGSYVPAYEAKISIVDGIYTRIGAGDALAQGLSTFMVEMIETAKILHNATSRSLIILDEVGRGTSTIDGVSIARAVLEYIHNKIKAKTLFATHFHELTNLDQRLKNLENYQVQVSEEEGEVKFLHKVEKGGTDKSYGVEVAKLAGVPEEVTKRAKQLLNQKVSNQLKLAI